MIKVFSDPTFQTNPLKRFFYLSLAIIIFLAYSNTFITPWIFDDFPNIVDNPPLHIDNLMPDTLWHTFFAQPYNDGKIFRPVACLSFALNWYIGQDNTIGYHIANIIIHYLTAVFLFLTILELFKTPRLNTKYEDRSAYFIALLATILWAIHPIQTQAVTYIVQRMASLAGMFSIIAIYLYLKGRLQKIHAIKYPFFCGICILLAIGSKENAILLPFNLLLIEYIFFPEKNEGKNNLFTLILQIFSLCILLGGIVFAIHQITGSGFFTPVGSRPFSTYERLLTESRIIFFYLGLLFYPLPTRLSLDHDISISTSFFYPWTTALSIFAIIILLFLAIQQIKRRPLISFAVLFFFLNHLIESTFIPLELVFEHRNYIPSLFLFLPFATGLHFLTKYYLQQNRFIYVSLFLFAGLLFSGIGVGTYIRNMSYVSSDSIWLDTLQKAPHSSRALSSLGISEGWGKKKSEEAFSKALAYHMNAAKSFQHNISYKAAILSNIAGTYDRYGLYEKAIDYNNQALKVDPTLANPHYNLARLYLKLGNFTEALKEATILIEKNPPHSNFFAVQGIALLWANKPEMALIAFRKNMSLIDDKVLAFYGIGTALARSGHHRQAEWFLGIAQMNEEKNIRIAFSRLENSLLAKDEVNAHKNVQYIFSQFSLVAISAALKQLPNDYNSLPVDIQLIQDFIKDTAQHQVYSLLSN